MNVYLKKKKKKPRHGHTQHSQEQGNVLDTTTDWDRAVFPLPEILPPLL